MLRNALLLVGLLTVILSAEGWGQGVVGPQLPQMERLTLERALNRALEKNAKIINARHQIEASRGLTIVAWAAFYPKLNFNASLEETKPDLFRQDANPFNDSYEDEWQLRFRVTQNLYSGGADTQNLSIAKLQGESDFIALQETIDEQLLKVKLAFYETLLRQSQIAAQRENILLLERERERQKNLFDAGRSTRFSFVRIEVTLANERPTLSQLETQLKNAQIQLAQYLGYPWPPSLGVAPFELSGKMDCPPVEANVESLITLAREQRPELKRLAKTIEIHERGIEVERATNRPKFDAFVGTDFSQADGRSDFLANQTDFSFGLLGRWNIFDGWAARGRAMIKQTAAKQAMVDRAQTYIDIESGVRRAFYTLQESRQTIQSQLQNVKQAQESLELARLSQETGYGTVLDVLQATVDLNRARNIENEARYRYLTSLAQLEQAVALRTAEWNTAGDQPPLLQEPILSGLMKVPGQVPSSAPTGSSAHPLIGPQRPGNTGP